MTSFYRSEYISSFYSFSMSGAVEDWEELLVPAQGRLVYVGQGQCQFVHFHEPTPGLLWPKKKRRKKKKAASQPPAPRLQSQQRIGRQRSLRPQLPPDS
jgi:hypothetical protein